MQEDTNVRAAASAASTGAEELLMSIV